MQLFRLWQTLNIFKYINSLAWLFVMKLKRLINRFGDGITYIYGLKKH